MKRILFFVISLVFAGLTPAQQPVDYLLRAKAFIESGKSLQAVTLLSEGLLKNQYYRLYIERAEAYIAVGDYNSAYADYQSANKLASLSGEFGISRIYALKGDPINALNHLENNINSPYKKSEKEIMLDAAFSFIENTPSWRLFWKKERYSIFEKKISEIEYYVSIGKPGDAGVVLNDLTSDYRENPDTQYGEALVNFSHGKHNESITRLTKLLEADNKNEKYLRLLAKVQSTSGNHSGASQSYSDLIDMGIPDAGLLLSRAECYKKTGETDKAIKDVTEFLDFYPENKAALSFAGRMAAQSGDNLKALDYFSKNLKLHPKDPDCYIDRGNSYSVSKTWDYAIKDYSMALDIQPDNSETWLNKGIALLNNGKTDDACHDFRAALNLGNKRATGYLSKYCIK
jgi:tetratricopeptide (TPR) repeat protein